MSNLSRFMLSIEIKDDRITVTAGGAGIPSTVAGRVMDAMASAAAAAIRQGCVGGCRCIRTECSQSDLPAPPCSPMGPVQGQTS